MLSCVSCGAPVYEAWAACPRCGTARNPISADPDDWRRRTPPVAVAICLRRYFRLRGRAPRAEFWYFVVFALLAPFVAALADKLLMRSHAKVVFTVVAVALIIPTLTVWARRMHDINRTAWWWPLFFVPVLGALVLLVWACRRGTRGPNRYGFDPLAGPSAIV